MTGHVTLKSDVPSTPGQSPSVECRLFN